MSGKEIFVILFAINVLIESTNATIDASSETTPDSSPLMSNVSLTKENIDRLLRQYDESQNKLFYSDDEELREDSLMSRCQLVDIMNGDCFTRLLFDSVCDTDHTPALIQGSTVIPISKDIIKGAGLSVDKLKNMIKSGALTCIHNKSVSPNQSSQNGPNNEGSSGSSNQPHSMPFPIQTNPPSHSNSHSSEPQTESQSLPNSVHRPFPIDQFVSNLSPQNLVQSSAQTNNMAQEMNKILLQLIMHLLNRNGGDNTGGSATNFIPNPCPSCTCLNCPRPNVATKGLNPLVNPNYDLSNILGTATSSSNGATGTGATATTNPFQQLVNAIIGMEKLKFDIFRQKVNADAQLINHKINFDLNLIKGSANAKQALINAIVQSLNAIDAKRQHDSPDASNASVASNQHSSGQSEASEHSGHGQTSQNDQQIVQNFDIEKQKNE